MNSYNDALNALKTQLKRSLCIDDSHFYYESLGNVEKSEGLTDYPVILFEPTDHWESYKDQTKIDLTKEIRANTDMKLYFYSMDLDELIRFEEFFRQFYSRLHFLSEICEDDSVTGTVVSLKPGLEPKHVNEKDYFKFEATLYIRDITQEEEIINPIKIELDMASQKRVMAHLSVVNEAWRNIFSARENLKDSEENKDKFDLYSKQLSDLEKQAADVYNFKDLTKIVLTLENDGFSKCYKLMCEQDINVTQASEIFQKQWNEEQEREKAAKEAEFKKTQQESAEATRTGKNISYEEVEDCLDRYTNLLVNDMKEKLNIAGDVPIYGGSTYIQYIWDNRLRKLKKYPMIVIKDDFQIMDETSYTVIGSEGLPIVRKATIKALPILYYVVINIFSRTEEELLDLESRISDLYENEVVFKAPNPIFRDNYCAIRFVVNNEQQIQRAVLGSGNKLLYRSAICFKAYPNVYYVTDYTKEELKNNFRLQWCQLKVAEGYMGAIGIIDNVIIKELDKLQTLMTSNQTGAFSRLLNGSDYMEINRCFLNHRPIRREAFEKVFSQIIKYHPSLYDEITSGHTVLEIKNNAEKFKKEIDRKVQLICAHLDIPVIIPGFENKNGRSREALQFCIKAMNADQNLSAEAAASKYAESLRQNMEMQAQRQEEYDDYYYSGGGSSSSGGMGFVGETAATAAGTWAGTTGIRREERRQSEMMRDEINRQKEYEKKLERAEHSRREQEQKREHYAKVEQAKKDHLESLHRSQEEYKKKQKSVRR